MVYFGTLILVNDDSVDAERMFIALFAIIWGAFGAGQAASYGPDAAKGKLAGAKVFKITDLPSEINSYAEPSKNAV